MQKPKRIVICRKAEDFDSELVAWLKHGPLGVDTETSGLKWQFYELVGAICLSAGETAVFAYKDALGPASRYLGDQVEASRELVFHNAKFDMHMLRATFGLHIPYPVHDTQIESFLLDNRGAAAYTGKGSKGKFQDHHLKSLATVFVDHTARDAEVEMMADIRLKGGKHKGDWLLAREDLFAIYGALDPWYTLQLHLQFIERIDGWAQPTEDGTKYPSLRSLYETERWLTLALRDMEERGIMAEPKFLLDWGVELDKSLTKRRARLIKLAGREINWNSPKQLGELLYDEMGLPIVKRTASNKPSTDGATLIELPHEIGPELVKYREEFKQHSSYATSLPRHIAADGAIHPDFKQTGADTGRMSCAGPNLQQQTRISGVRSAYHPRRGLVLRFADYCLTAETEIETLRGPKPIIDVRPGDKVYTWRDGAIEWGEVTKQALVGILPTFKVTLDSGESFCGTGDHELVQRDGGKIKINELTPGTSLAAFRYGTGGLQGRQTVYSLSNRRYRYVHQIMAEAYFGPRPKGFHVHHIDEDPFNNSPDNLTYLSATLHHQLHDSFANVDEEKRLSRLREATLNRRSYADEGNPNWQGGTIDRDCEICGKSFKSYPPSRLKKRCVCCRKPGRIPRRALNHKVISVEPNGVRPVYHITVETDHNFVLSVGIVSANSQVEMRFASHFAGEQSLIDGFINDPDFDTHTMTGQKMYGREVLKGQERKFAKIINFTKLFGGGEGKVTEQLVSLLEAHEAMEGLNEFGIFVLPAGLTPWRALAQKVIERFNAEMPSMVRAIKREAKTAERRGFVMNAFGQHRYIDDKFYKAFNTKVQGTAGQQAKKGLVNVYREMQLNRGELALVLQIHDENVYESEGDPKTDRMVLELMQDVDSFSVPIIADMSGTSTNWQSKVKIEL